MIRHGGEVEGALQLQLAQRLALGVGLDAERLAPREAIGVPGRVARALRARVLGVGGVDVQIPVVRRSKRIEVRAGFALFGDRVRVAAGAAGEAPGREAARAPLAKPGEGDPQHG